MKNNTCFFAIFFIFILHVNGQELDFNNYTPLKCQGTIPADFKAELSKMMAQVKNDSSIVNSRDKKTELEFAELADDHINHILYSGKILYGDVLTDYVNKVADIVLKSAPELRQQLRFYVLKNADVNASSTRRGIIFIHVGMLAQIENEAQLAYLICHEAVHFRNKHGIQKYKNRQELISDKNKYLNSEDKLKSMMRFSKESELEADREGLELFLKSPYSTNDINNLFDVMLYSYLPFDDLAFAPVYFNKGDDYWVPWDYFLKEVKQIEAKADVPDSWSSHPNIQKRRSAIERLLETKKKSSGASYVMEKSAFENMQRVARHELAIAHLVEGDYEEAFYAAYLIERIYGKSLFSDKVICTALYAISKQKNYYESISEKRLNDRNIFTADGNEDLVYWKHIQGESQNVYYFFNRIPARELNVLAAMKMYDCFSVYKDHFFEARFKDLVSELINVHSLSRDRFSKGRSNDTAMKQNAGETKLSKIRKKEEAGSAYYLYAFTNCYDDSLFLNVFYHHEELKEKNTKRKTDLNYITYSREKEKILKKHGEGLNIDKIAMINPYYSNYLFRYLYLDTVYFVYRIKNPDFRPLEEVAIEKRLSTYVSSYASELKVDVDLMGLHQSSEIETDRFNDFQQMISWSTERVSLGKINSMIYNDQFIGPYAQTYGYIGFFSVENVYRTLEVHFILFDLKTGEVKLFYEQELRKAKGDGLQVKMMIYDILHRIKQDPDKVNLLKKKYGIEE